jgi:hypothetical protein
VGLFSERENPLAATAGDSVLRLVLARERINMSYIYSYIHTYATATAGDSVLRLVLAAALALTFNHGKW